MPRQWRHSGELQKSCASSANLFAFICGPPWAWIDWSAVLTELNIENGLARGRRENGCDLGCRPHGRDRLPRKYKLADVYRNALHPGDQDMIPAPGVEDQELSIAAERPGVNNQPSHGVVTWAPARVAKEMPFSAPPAPSEPQKSRILVPL